MSVDSCTDTSSEYQQHTSLYQVVLIVSVCAIVLGIIANFFIIISFCKVKRLRTVTNCFIFQLSIADVFLLSSLAAWLSYPNFSMSEHRKNLVKDLLISIEIFSSSASLTSLACVSIDRCLAVTLSLRYQSIMTNSRALVVVITVWIYSFITLIMSYSRALIDLEMYNRLFIALLFSFTFALPILITMWSYYRIFCTVWRQVHQVPEHIRNCRLRMVMKEFRNAINILLIIVVSYLLWGILFIATLREAFLESRPCYSAVVNWLLGNSHHFVGTVNPIIYIAMTRGFRRQFLHLLPRKKVREEFAVEMESSKPRTVSARSCSTTQSVPLIDDLSSQDLFKLRTKDGKSTPENLCTESVL